MPSTSQEPSSTVFNKPKYLDDLLHNRRILSQSNHAGARNLAAALEKAQTALTKGDMTLTHHTDNLYEILQNACDYADQGQITEDEYLAVSNDLGVQREKGRDIQNSMEAPAQVRQEATRNRENLVRRIFTSASAGGIALPASLPPRERRIAPDSRPVSHSSVAGMSQTAMQHRLAQANNHTGGHLPPSAMNFAERSIYRMEMTANQIIALYGLTSEEDISHLGTLQRITEEGRGPRLAAGTMTYAKELLWITELDQILQNLNIKNREDKDELNRRKKQIDTRQGGPRIASATMEFVKKIAGNMTIDELTRTYKITSEDDINDLIAIQSNAVNGSHRPPG